MTENPDTVTRQAPSSGVWDSRGRGVGKVAEGHPSADGRDVVPPEGEAVQVPAGGCPAPHVPLRAQRTPAHQEPRPHQPQLHGIHLSHRVKLGRDECLVKYGGPCGPYLSVTVTSSTCGAH